MNAALKLSDQQVADENHDWRDGAPCGEVDPEIFFDLATEDPGIAKMAKDLCHGCPIRRTCLDTAMLNKEEYGIWGGMDAQERRSHWYLWNRVKGGKGAVRALRDDEGIVIHDPSIDRRYSERLRAARAARAALVAVGEFERKREYLQVLDMIVANPTDDAGKLAKRLGRSTTWFNTLKRESYAKFGVVENHSAGDAA